MKNNFLYLALVAILGTLTACTNQPATPSLPANNLQVTAINNFRLALGLPDLPLESKGMEHMINSPSGDLPVAFYVDSEGRKYYVEPQTNIVVEMDARDLLASIPADAPAIPEAQAREKVKQMLAVAIPNFASLSQSLTYEEGGKVGNYFFNWYRDISPGDFNRAFIQVGVYKTGFVFAYYNTIIIK